MKRKYAWEDWFAQAPTELQRGDHYTVSQSAMYQMILTNASARGVRVRVRDTGSGFTIEVTGRRVLEISDGEAGARTRGELPVGSDRTGKAPRLARCSLPPVAHQDGVVNGCGG